MAETLTLEAIEAMWSELAAAPHIRVVVSRHVPGDAVVKAPPYYDSRKCRMVEMWIIGGEAWHKLACEFPPLPGRTLFPGVPVEFSPSDWRPTLPPAGAR